MTHAKRWHDWHRRRKFQSALCSGWSKKWEEKLWDVSGNPLLSVAVVQKRLEKSTRMLNNLKNHGNRILIIIRWESFHRWSYLQLTELPGRNAGEWCLWPLQSVNNETSSLYHDASLRSMNRDKTPLVWFELGYRLTFSWVVLKTFWRRKLFHGSRRY